MFSKEDLDNANKGKCPSVFEGSGGLESASGISVWAGMSDFGDFGRLRCSLSSCHRSQEWSAP